MLPKSHPSFLLSFHQIYSNREVEEAMTKIRDVLSDDKKDWELRVAAVRRPDLSVISFEHHFKSFLTVCFPLPPAEEGSFAAPGRRSRVRWIPAAAEAHGSCVQTIRQGPPVSGGERGLHHSGVRLQTCCSTLTLNASQGSQTFPA